MQPKYPAAAESIRKWITHEKLVPGSLLPAGRLLAAKFGCSQSAIERACVVLVTEGLLSRQGRKLKVQMAGQNRPKIEGIIYVLSYSERFAQSTRRILTEEGIEHRVVQLSPTKHPYLEPVLRETLAAKPGGLIVSRGIQIEEEAAKLLAGTTIPIVTCGDLGASTKSSIQADIYRGTETALRHLHGLGHRHIAHVSERGSPEQKELAEHYRSTCLKLGLKQSASTIWEAESTWHEILPDTLLGGHERHPEVTAIFAADRICAYAIGLFSIPRELSVIGYRGLEETFENHPSLTTIALRDPEAMSSWACLNLISQIRRAQGGFPPRPPTHALLVPELILKHSTRALNRSKAVPEISGQPSLPKVDPEKSWGNIYAFLKNSPAPDWRQLDLSKLANHSMKRQHGWLGGDPLLHFPPGLRSIHGVPFQVLDEEQNDGRGVITFRSPQAHSTEGEELPIKAKIEVDATAKALYFLHGCGYVKPLPFAHYIIRYREGPSVSLALIPLGASRAFALKHLGSLKPNLQDWWRPTFEPEDFPHAHHVTVFNPHDPTAYQRSLYTLEWINPRPKDKITAIEVKVDPKAGPTLALVAVTALF